MQRSISWPSPRQLPRSGPFDIGPQMGIARTIYRREKLKIDQAVVPANQFAEALSAAHLLKNLIRDHANLCNAVQKRD